MTRTAPETIATVPLVEEQLNVGKQTVETGRVRVRTTVEEAQAWVCEDLVRVDAEVERVPVGRYVDVAPEPRTEGDVLIVPVVEEVLVVEKRLRLTEEIRVRQRRTVERVEQPFTLRSSEAVVERRGPDGDGSIHSEQTRSAP